MLICCYVFSSDGGRDAASGVAFTSPHRPNYGHWTNRPNVSHLHVMQTHAGFWQRASQAAGREFDPSCRLQRCHVECAVTTSSRDVQDVCQSE